MIKVNNRKAIANLSRKSFCSNKLRNGTAIIAIMLTTILFTTVLTIMGTLLHSFEQQAFRMYGGDDHGSFKNLTDEQLEELSGDDLITSFGARCVLGGPLDEPFNKCCVEISYMDRNCTESFFCTPAEGRLPREGTKEIICDKNILDLLGIEAKIGAQVPITYYVGKWRYESNKVTDTFTLCGWWEHDSVSPANFINVPLSYVKEVLGQKTYEIDGDAIGTWDLYVKLKSAKGIEDKLIKILEKHHYQGTDVDKENFINTGVNPAYLYSQFDAKGSIGTVLALGVLIVLFILAGYMIIYNIFQISVVRDIQFYGLLKTIGTTKRQIQRILYKQAGYLCAMGIPLGLLIGYVVGVSLGDMAVGLTSCNKAMTSRNPLIFYGAALFSLFTVFLSCRRPARMAGKIAPVEAVKYAEGNQVRKQVKKKTHKNTISHMAWANLGRNKKKTVLVVLSMTLGIVLFESIYMFVHGFDRNRFVSEFSVCDYQIASANYYEVSVGYRNPEDAVEEDDIKAIEEQGKFTKSGRIYGYLGQVNQHAPVDWYRAFWKKYFHESDSYIEESIEQLEKDKDGKLIWYTQLYGMEAFPMEKLEVKEGSLEKMKDPNEKAIIAVYSDDDYGNVIEESQWAKVGDQVTLSYGGIPTYIDKRTGEEINLDDAISNETYKYVEERMEEPHEETYTVVAVVTIPQEETFRYYGSNEFILNAERYQKDSNQSYIMSYMGDVKEGAEKDMDVYVKDYTEKVNPLLSYESRDKMVKEFENLEKVFLVVGGALCGIMCLIGILNFMNVVVTSIITRRHELAMLKSIGMTVAQLRKMLIYEGIWYAVITILISLGISILTLPLFRTVLNAMIWFFKLRISFVPYLIMTPVLFILGIVIPYVTYRITSNKSVVEELREVE